MSTKDQYLVKKSWFLEGSNRYLNSPVYRAEVPLLTITPKKALSFINKKKLPKNLVKLNAAENISTWEIAIKALLFLANAPLVFYKETPANPGNIYSIFNITSQEAGDALLSEAAKLVQSKLKMKLKDSAAKIIRIKDIYEPGSINSRYIEEANKRNIPYIILNKAPFILQLGYGSKSKKTWSALTSKTLRIGARITANKFITSNLLRKVDIPVPQSAVISNKSELHNLFDKYLKPVVIKPADSTVGKGVSMNIASLSQAKKAYEKALAVSKKIIIEEQIKGYYYRVTFVDGKMIACAKAFPAHVIGDGKRRLRRLIDEENDRPYRQKIDKNKAFYKIEINEKIKRIISSQGYALNSLIKKGEKVLLSFSGADGGEWVEDNSSVHPENIKLMERALKLVGLNISGIDILSPDISVPFKENGGKLLEINAGPDINIHANVNQGRKIIVEQAIIKTLFKEGEDGRIPLVSITGTNGKTTTSKLIAHMINDPDKWDVGLTTSENKYINGKIVAKGDKSGYLSAQSLLINPDIDVAILETCHILGVDRRGLGYDWSDASVITNLTGDHVGTFCTRTEKDLFDIKSVVARRTKKDGYIILNADDSQVVKMAKKTKARLVYFGLDHQNKFIKNSRRVGYPIYYYNNGGLWEEIGGKKKLLASVKNIPITFGGTAEFNVYNCLAALAVVRSVFNRQSLKQIRERLKSFGISPKSNPGRFNIIKKDNFSVIVDYAHNPDGYEKVIALAKKIPHRRLVGVIKSAGDRPDDFIRELGRIAGNNFDYIYAKDPSREKIRGRKEGKVAKLLKDGVLETKFSPKNLKVIYNEIDAVKRALKNAEKGDLILIFAHEIDQIIELVESF